MSRDEYYATREARIDTLIGSVSYYNMLMRLNDIYKGEFTDLAGFADWCKEQHGFRPSYADDGGITVTPEIIDDKKYALCLLKYSG